jgi:hypothetical protein
MTAIYQDEMFAFGTRSGARCFETLELSNPRARWQFHGDILSEYISHDIGAGCCSVWR